MRKGETVMKILAINPISFKKRMTEFLFDYLFILAYLVLLFLGSMLIYIILFNVACIFHLCFANHAPVHILGL